MYPAFVHGERRSTPPLRRVGSRGDTRFERISWDAALDMIHERFTAIIAAHGPQAILPLNYAGPHGPARPARGRLDGLSILPPARREPARPEAALRWHSRRGVGGDVRSRPR